MRMSTLARYGARAMVDLACCQERSDAPVNLKTIAERQDVSYRYLEQIMLKLRATGLVRSVRGAGGGFVLARPATQITLAQVVEALEGRTPVVECTEDPSLCNRSPFCVTRPIWAELAQAMRSRLEAITIKELADRQASTAQALSAAYATRST